MKIYTIGYSGKTKDQFMEVLDAVDIHTVIDVRLWRGSKFVEWASEKSLADTFGNRYKQMSDLCPTHELLVGYKDGTVDWSGYERVFGGLISERKIEKLFDENNLNGACFLCAEKTADKCHRRLIAEYLATHFPDVKIVHL